MHSFVCLFGWLVVFLTSSSTTRLYRGRAPRQERLTILRAATHETELGDHDFCLSRSHYTDTGHSGNRTRDLLTRSRALYRRATAPPPECIQLNDKWCLKPRLPHLCQLFDVDVFLVPNFVKSLVLLLP